MAWRILHDHKQDEVYKKGFHMVSEILSKSGRKCIRAPRRCVIVSIILNAIVL